MMNLGMPVPGSVAMGALGQALTPQMMMPSTLPVSTQIPQTVSPIGGGGFDWMSMLPMAAGLLNQPQEQQQPQLQPPGLLMPNIQIMPYQPPPLTALGGLLGGG